MPILPKDTDGQYTVEVQHESTTVLYWSGYAQSLSEALSNAMQQREDELTEGDVDLE